jgi:probable rRNA maturation factor
MLLNRQCEAQVTLQPLANFLRRVQMELGISAAELNICLVSEVAMRRLNREFREKDKSTDVLSFPAEDRAAPAGKLRRLQKQSRPGARRFLGDVAISPRVARRNAKRLGRGLDEELRVLILHGVLHLMGYDHQSDAGEMNCLETRLRRRFGLPQT